MSTDDGSPESKTFRDIERQRISSAIASITKTETMHELPIEQAGEILVGYNRKLKRRRLTRSEAITLLDGDLQIITDALRVRIARLNRLNYARAGVLLHTAIYIPVDRLESCAKLWAALGIEDYEAAADELQVVIYMSGEIDDEGSLRRSQQLSRVMRTGHF